MAGPVAKCLSVLEDLGYAIGALAAGLIADFFGFAWAIAAVGALTFLSGLIVAVVMKEKRPEITSAPENHGES
jgi:hypothetical protein